MEGQTLISIINQEMDIGLPEQIPFEEMRAKLQAEVSKLIETDFQKLINILYRVDVNERKLKYLLQENVGAGAADIIADLIIERQIEKIKLRQQYRRLDDDISDEEKW